MKCGIEIHQRICSHKLFCDCDATGSKGEAGQRVNRYLQVVAGETGEVDRAVSFEALRSNKFIYESYANTSCLIETDSEPPINVNQDALSVALSVARHLKMFVPDELHVMRKTVIDGSNTGGFQRTMVVGLGTEQSVINTSEGPVRVKDLELEEESARIIERRVGGTTYDLSGLGVPLIEVGTHPDITSPQQAYETALAIGELLRLTGHAQRGIGTIRQDVNVSVDGGARVEIKGFQDIKNLKQLVDLEVKRQESLIALKQELTGYKLRTVNVTELFGQSKFFKGKKLILGLVLPSFNGLFKRKLNELKTLGSEVADYARAYGVKGLIHSDEDLSKYGLVDEFILARNELGLNNNDLLLVIAGDGLEVERSIKAVADRVYLLNDYVPEETRVAGPDGVSVYARPLPGGERMYPETDVPLITPLKNSPVIESKAKRVKELSSYGLTDELVNELVLSPRLVLFRSLVNRFKKIKPLLIARLLVNIPKDVKKRFGFDVSVLDDVKFIDLLSAINDSSLIIESAPLVLRDLCKSGLNVSDIIGSYRQLSNAELRKIVNAIIKSHPNLSVKQYMGLVMIKARGRAIGSRINDLLLRLV
ncbi:MAG: Glu-tRNA(Gln) amidotransferase subunit GatE [Candidatus Nanoarchaeia archaeon]|jgi:glutamyl-tRNA(Gln) amidotransferase subunit E